MKPEELYEKIRELQSLKDDIETDIKKYKTLLDQELVPEREPEVKIIEVPEYISDIELYVENRYPIFDIVNINGRAVKIVEKDSYVPKKMVFDNGGQFYRRVSHGKPTINIELLKENYPKYYDSIVTMVPEIDEAKLNQKLEDDPDFLRVVEEVLQMVRPSVALVATKPKEDEE